MGFQIRHKTFGLFQGTTFGPAAWTATSGTPELGIHEFQTRRQAEHMIEKLAEGDHAPAIDFKELTIEPFDQYAEEQTTKGIKYYNV